MEKVTFLVNDESLNSHGFRVLTSGIDTSRFEKNPIMLYMHEIGNVIGRWENLRKDGDKLYADAVFDTNDPQAKLIADKVKNGFLKSTSLGLEILEKQGDVATKTKLFEISIVDMGSNENALKLYNKKEVFKLFYNLNIQDMDLLQSLIALLGLKAEASNEDVLKKVEELTQLEISQQNLQNKSKQELLTNSVRLGKITADMIPHFSKMLDSDFENTTQLLAKMPEKVDLKKGLITPKNNGLSLSKENPTDKPKSQWNLEDYRLHAPQELESNPELYQRLVKETYNN